MITYGFPVKNKERLIELQSFMRENMPTARFKHEPYSDSNGRYTVILTFESTDQNKLCVLMEKWHQLDNPPIPKSSNIFFKKIYFFIDKFKSLCH